MVQDLHVTTVQTDLHWESPGANMAMLEEKIWHHSTNSDIIVLPEMFTTGFTMNASSVAEPMNLTTMKWMKQIAAQRQALLIGSYIVKENFLFYNRLICMQPDGQYLYYDKRHLFRMAGEEKVFTAGTDRLIINYKGWKLRPLICYDLRFPVWSRNINTEYDVLIYVANWPAARSHAWNTLLRARAIENVCYTIGVNRIGMDYEKNLYSGNSALIDFKGMDLNIPSTLPSLETYSINLNNLQAFRDKFPVDLDADRFKLDF